MRREQQAAPNCKANANFISQPVLRTFLVPVSAEAQYWCGLWRLKTNGFFLDQRPVFH
jgi:hypothetical protein